MCDQLAEQQRQTGSCGRQEQAMVPFDAVVACLTGQSRCLQEDEREYSCSSRSSKSEILV